MNNSTSILRKILDEVPPDLSAYFDDIADGSFSGRKDLEVNLLSAPDVVKLTQEFRDFHPIVDALNGVILDDPDTSNHHMYLASPACAGSVFFLDHDGNSRIVFANISDLVAQARLAIRNQTFLGDSHSSGGIVLSNQSELSRLVGELYEAQRDVEILISLIPSLDLRQTDLLNRLAADPDFYVGEAIGNEIARRPRLDLESLATIVANHDHPQAANAGKHALSAIAAIR